jgi:hypothetical protein
VKLALAVLHSTKTCTLESRHSHQDRPRSYGGSVHARVTRALFQLTVNVYIFSICIVHNTQICCCGTARCLFTGVLREREKEREQGDNEAES